MNKEISVEEIKKNLKLPKNVKQQKIIVEEIEKKLNEEKERFNKFVRKWKSVCKHSYEKIFKPNPNYHYDPDWPFDRHKEILNFFMCTKCGHKKPTREGSKFDVCKRCDGDMKHVETIPGQGVRIFVYERKECGHAEAHT